MFYKDKVREILIKNNSFKKMEKYADLIEKKNQVMNLTGFSGDNLWQQGIYESIVCLNQFNIQGKLLDIGAGAGFPSIPYLIFKPQIDLTIIEPSQKRVSFLEEVKKELDLHFQVIHKRAEETQEHYQYDFITARAVSALYKLIEVSFHLGKLGSKFIFIKGPKFDEEISDAKKIINSLNIKIEPKKVSEITNKQIVLIAFNKNKKHPIRMPKKWNKIKK